MNKKNNSPYTAAITGGGFLFEETGSLLPLLLADDSEALLNDEKVNNRRLHINAESSRSKAIGEIKRRFAAMPRSFWDDYRQMSGEDQTVALFFVILKTYKICFDLHVNVTMRRWNGIRKTVSADDLKMEFSEIAAHDAFVDTWSEATKRKVASAYLTILRKVGILGGDDTLRSVACSNPDYYVTIGEQWFLEACLLQPYEIDNIKRQML